MALMLRKACQPALNDADLDAFHADMDTQKRLVLFTPCGKRFAVVHGITFGRFDVTKAEIDFTVELLEGWLLRNDKKIDTYLEAFSQQQQMEEPDTQLFVGKSKITINTKQVHERSELTGRYEYVVKPNGLVIEHDHVSFTLDTNLELASICPDTKHRPEFPWTDSIQLDPEVLETAIVQLAKCVEYRQAKETVARILGELNSCSDSM